jgi:hypothetical protein
VQRIRDQRATYYRRRKEYGGVKHKRVERRQTARGITQPPNFLFSAGGAGLDRPMAQRIERGLAAQCLGRSSPALEAGAGIGKAATLLGTMPVTLAEDVAQLSGLVK